MMACFRPTILHCLILCLLTAFQGIGYAQDKSIKAPELPAFPLAVWLQIPKKAPRYKEAGINLYVGLWKGPTEGQLAELSRHGMPVVCGQNAVGIGHVRSENPVIVGWLQPDEPDNAQSIVAGWDDLKKAKVRVTIDGSGFGKYGPPVPPARIVAAYRRMKAVDPSRPVLLNLGQGVAWRYPGRGVRTGHNEDYPEYLEGCDIASFDIYPSRHRNDKIRGKLHKVAEGQTNLRRWAGPDKPRWAVIECNRAGFENERPTPDDVRAQVWMAIVHGARGIVYFVHHFDPFVEAGLLRDKEMLREVTALNRQITRLAPAIVSDDIPDRLAVRTEPDDAPVAAVLKRHDGALYVFAVCMRAKETRATFVIGGLGKRPNLAAEVLDEDRTRPLDGGAFTDRFGPYGVGLYRIAVGE